MTVTNKEIKQWECLVNKIVKRHVNTELTYEDKEDIIQIANMALCRALETYNSNTGIPFINYASICISRDVHKAIKNLKHNPNVGSFENIDCIGDNTTNKIDKQIYNTDMVIRVFKVIHRLNIDIINKKILALKVMGYSNPEIASKLNLKKNQVGDAIYRHKQKLIDKINGGRQ